MWLALEALRALARNKLRSGLTTLGITIGIAAVVTVVAIGKAGSEHAEQQLENLGNNLVWVEAGSRNINGARTGNHGTTSLTFDDAEAILHEVRFVRTMSPQVDGTVFATHGRSNWTTRYRGVGPDYLDIKRWGLAFGAPLTEEEVEESASVVLVGQTVAAQLFPGQDPIGGEIQIGSQLFQVIGVLWAKGQTATGQDQDDAILLPYTTAQKKLRGRGIDYLDDVLCSATSQGDVDSAVAAITALMRQRHHIAPGDPDDFNLRRPDEVLKAQIEASRALALFLISIASVSLLVGGIGIMNVMLVSVTERTKEIGIRLAVGATERDVVLQFLAEAIALSALGGLLGAALGVVASFALGRFLEWPVTIPPESVLLALASSSLVGIVSGAYPARRASRLDPIVALRDE
jgi:putative ABC transport system permease protein